MKIGAVTCVRDEAHIIEEWVAHHLALGIERIHIFDNLSKDGTRQKIERIHANVPSVTVETWNPGIDVQRLAFERGLGIMTAEEVDWCAFIDADEFIADGQTASSDRLRDLLARHGAHCAIGLHWAIFGSSGHVGRPGGMIQESFLHRADENFPPNRHIKSIVRPKYTMGAHNMHGFSLDHSYYTATGQEIEWLIPYAVTINHPDLTGWRINHYFCQWRNRWDMKIEQAKLRHYNLRTEADWVDHDRNEVFDPSALRWTPDDRAEMDRITR